MSVIPLTPDTDTYDPMLASEQRGYMRGRRSAEAEYRRGFEAGILTALSCCIVATACLIVISWWFAR